MSVIAVFNQKGGVGKTTTCLNVAAGLQRMNFNPLAIDLDSQAHLTLASGLRGVPSHESIASFFQEDKALADLVKATSSGCRIIPSHIELSKIDALHGSSKSIAGKLRAGLNERLAQDSRFILLDCCPTLGVLTLNAVLASDRVLIPVSADHLSMQGVHRLDTALRALENKLDRCFERRVVVTRFDTRRRLSYEIYNALSRHFGAQLCRTRIAENVSLAESPAYGRDIFAYAPNSQGAKDYQALIDELIESGFLN